MSVLVRGALLHDMLPLWPAHVTARALFEELRRQKHAVSMRSVQRDLHHLERAGLACHSNRTDAPEPSRWWRVVSAWKWGELDVVKTTAGATHTKDPAARKQAKAERRRLRYKTRLGS